MAKCSIIVPVYNDSRYITNCITSLKNQIYPKDHYEIIIIDDGSTDKTSEIVKSFEGVSYIYQENQGPSSARNRGISIAKGDYVLFTDSDCEVARDWIEKLISAFSQGVASVGGVQIGHPDDNEFAKKVDRFLRAIGFIGDYVKPHRVIREVSHNASCNAAYKTEIIKDVGGFRVGMFPGEDVDLDKRLRDKGYKILFTPEAVVYHHRPNDRKKWHRMLVNYGKASANNLLLHGPFRLIQLVPILLPLLVLFAGLFLIVNQNLTIIITCFFALIVIIFLNLRSQLSIKDTLIFSLETVLLFCWGFWKQFLQKKRIQ